MPRHTLLLSAAVFALTGCPDDPHDHNEGEVITTVALSFSGSKQVDEFTWADPEDDGSPVIDDITLFVGTSYNVSVRFLNELESPAEDITEEVGAESDQHQVFFTGDAVQGPASTSASAFLTHAYADEDAGGLPIGLASTITVDEAGTGDLVVTLRHLPEEGGVALKLAGLAADVAEGGFAAIAGDSDVQVTFPVTAQ